VSGSDASRRDNFFGGAARNFLIDIYDADGRAFGGESEGNRAADATSRAGND
jgi:hypothetical protein